MVYASYSYIWKVIQSLGETLAFLYHCGYVAKFSTCQHFRTTHFQISRWTFMISIPISAFIYRLPKTITLDSNLKQYFISDQPCIFVRVGSYSAFEFLPSKFLPLSLRLHIRSSCLFRNWGVPQLALKECINLIKKIYLNWWS